MTVQTLLNLLVKMPGDALIRCNGDMRNLKGEFKGVVTLLPDSTELFEFEGKKYCFLGIDGLSRNPLQV